LLSKEKAFIPSSLIKASPAFDLVSKCFFVMLF
jgi:hypothetical protein